MNTFSRTKAPGEAFPILVSYVNDDGTPTYTIASLTITATDESGTEALPDIVDEGLSSHSGNQASVWIKDGQDSGKQYTVLVLAIMTDGEKLEEKLIINIQD